MNVRPARLRLSGAPVRTTARPTWQQLAAGDTPAIIAGNIMGVSLGTARRMLKYAHAVLESDRMNGTLKVACDAAGADCRRVKVVEEVSIRPMAMSNLTDAEMAHLPTQEYAGAPYQLKIDDGHLRRSRFTVKHDGAYGEWEKAA